MTGSYLLGKAHTILDCLAHPRLISYFGKNVIPDTYCRLDTKWMRQFRFDTVLDIGANIGRFASTINVVFPSAVIYAFEPLPDCYELTKQVISRIGHGKAFNVGLGERSERLQINLNLHTPSSSFLSLSDTHVAAFPFAIQKSSTFVEVVALDDIVADLSIGKSMFVKIDVQGYERAVIMGGRSTIAKARMILIELSYEELYRGQPLFGEISVLLCELGFKFVGTLAQMHHPSDGRILDADCLFVKG
jgi:FkbM family methyltransferase